MCYAGTGVARYVRGLTEALLTEFPDTHFVLYAGVLRQRAFFTTLARDLPWQSKYANEENVRQVVRRLRGALTEAGGDGLLAVVPGRGYYLSCPVAVAR